MFAGADTGLDEVQDGRGELSLGAVQERSVAKALRAGPCRIPHQPTP
jgi:hypothetical protein